MDVLPQYAKYDDETSICKAIIKLKIQHSYSPRTRTLHDKLMPPTIEQSPDEHLPGAQLHQTVERLEGAECGYQAGQRRHPRPPWQLKLPFRVPPAPPVEAPTIFSQTWVVWLALSGSHGVAVVVGGLRQGSWSRSWQCRSPLFY